MYRVRNRSRADAVLSITPFLQFVSKGSDLGPEQEFRFRAGGAESGGMDLHVQTDGTAELIPECEETYFYSYDVCDGEKEHGDCKGRIPDQGCREGGRVPGDLGRIFSIR